MSDPYDLEAGPDPAALAAAEPEPDDWDGTTESPVHAVGIGPGNLDYLTPRGRQAIETADVIVGFTTVTEFLTDGMAIDGTVLACGYRDEAETLTAFADAVADGATGTAVLMGDPNHSGYQFLGKVETAIDRPVRVIPGISALQLAASRARTPMEATTFVTLHKSGDVAPDLDRLRNAVGDRHLLVLPRPFDLMPEDIAADLLATTDADPKLQTLVLERLTHADERITRSTLGEIAAGVHPGTHDPGEADGQEAEQPTEEASDAESAFSDLSVLAIRTTTAPEGPQPI